MTKRNNTTSILSLIFANAVMLMGVWFWDWQMSQVVVLYWFESAIIGFFNVLKMATAQGFAPTKIDFDAKKFFNNSQQSQQQLAALKKIQSKGAAVLSFVKVFMICFFIMHYSGFMTGHLFFLVFFMTVNPAVGVTTTVNDYSVTQTVQPESLFFNIGQLLSFYSLLPVVSLFVSHLISYLTNYIGHKEYEIASIIELMFKPYKRIVLMHLTLIFGFFLTFLLGDRKGLVTLFLVLKTLIDLKAHKKEHGFVFFGK